MILALLACKGADPQLQPYADAAEAWRRGQEASAAAERIAAYQQALAADPQSAVLGLWLAKSQADASDLVAADATLSQVLRDHPDAGAAWYNRAAYRARAHRMEESAADLKRALGMGVRSPLEAAADPDFAAARTDPAFAGLLPPQPLVIRVDGPDGAVFLGSRFPVDVYVAANPGVELSLRREGDDPGCVRLVRVVEDQRFEARMAVRHFVLDFIAEGRCAGAIGSFAVGGGDAVVRAEPTLVQVELPEGANTQAPPALPLLLPVPSALAPEGSGYAARRVGDGVAGIGRADQAITAEGRAPDVDLEWRVDGQTRAKGGWWRGAGPLELRSKSWSERVE